MASRFPGDASSIMKFTATAPPHLAKLLAEEITSFGATRVQAHASTVSFQGDLDIAYRACLWSRIASRILLPLTDVDAPTPKALYDAVAAIRWERHLDSKGTLAVEVAGQSTGISHSRYAALTVKDAIVDRFREQFGERPSVDTEHPDLLVHLFLHGAKARLSLDLSGGSLHRRGYRLEGAFAPLKENLAAAILQLAGWAEIARRGGGLFDPMCGSGTLLIEGAWLAGDVAPGLLRKHFGFLGWKRHDDEVWQSLLVEAGERRDSGLAGIPPIIGYDRDRRALEAALANIERAGLNGKIRIEHRPLSADMPLPQGQPGLLVSNPPYGERLGEAALLRPLYTGLGQLLKERMPAWRGAVLTANPELGALIGLRPVRAETLDNGGIACRLLVFEGTADHAAEQTQPEILSPGTAAFVNRITKNLKHLGRWARRAGVSCFRVYDQDLPEYALAIDLYQCDGERVIHVQEYQAPATVDQDLALARLEEALSVLPTALDVAPQNLFLKVRRRQKGGRQYDKQGQTGRMFEIDEYGAHLLVNFTDYLDTGIFLDHRPIRRLLREAAQEKRFLNLFCYTGTATVQAALGGALRTVSVDLSATYIDWARRNLERNGFPSECHELVRADVVNWLEVAVRQGRQFDLIFCDPPTISRSKRMEGAFDVQRDHVHLIRTAIKLLAPTGTLYFSNNFRKFRLDEALSADLAVVDISGQTLDEDFKRRPNIHKCWRIRHREAEA